MNYENKVWWFFYALYWFSNLFTIGICVRVSMPPLPIGYTLCFGVTAISFLISWYVPKNVRNKK